MAGNVDSSDISEAIKEYLIPFTTQKDGVRVPISLVQLVDGTKRPIPFISNSAPWGNGVPTWIRDATLNDSDKSFTVPVGKIWILTHLYMILTATATVGNRNLTVRVNNTSGQEVAIYDYATAIAAGETRVREMAFEGFTDDWAVGPSGLSVGGMSKMIIPGGYSVRLYDSAAIDAAADDLTINLNYLEYDA